MLEFVKGDFFDYEADIRINTVNCVSVMGAGVALAFKNKFPEMFKEYVKDCKSGALKPGHPIVWSNSDMFSSGITIINFPTKNHWRKPSEFEYVESGLKWLASYLSDKTDKVVTLPALGCGHGGLDWKKVKLLIEKYLIDSPAKILVFEPSSSKKAGKISVNINKLTEIGINIIEGETSLYPNNLDRYTKKNLYYFGNSQSMITFDVALVCSTKPDNEEKEIVRQFLEYCARNNLRVVFGSSVFDKKLAVEYSKNNLDVGVFLPSGIYDTSKKIIKNSSFNKIHLLSTGNPFKNFDRKEYIPSVLSRMFISNQTFITTARLSWLSKHKKKIIENKIITKYIPYKNLDIQDVEAMLAIHSIKILFSNVNAEKVYDFNNQA